MLKGIDFFGLQLVEQSYKRGLNKMEIKKVVKGVALGSLMLGATFLAGCNGAVVEHQKNQIDALSAKLDSMETKSAGLEQSVIDLTGIVKTNDGVINSLQIAKENAKKLAAENDAKILEDAKTIEALNTEIAGLKVEVTGAGDGATGKVLEMDFNAPLDASKRTIDDSDINLINDKVEFDGDDYDVKEEVIFTDAFKLMTSIEGDENFAEKPYLVTTDEGAIAYKYIIEDDLDASEISEDEPLNIKFLGKDLEIIEADNVTGEITVREGAKFLMDEGATKTITLDGKDYVVTVDFVSSDGGAKFSINGQVTSTLDEGETDEASDIEVSVIEILDNEAAEGRADKVEFYLGETVYKTIADGDEYTEDVEDFIYTVEFDGANLRSIGVSYDRQADDLEDIEDGFEPIAIGKELVFPEGYVKVKFLGVTDVSYNQYDLTLEEQGDTHMPVVQLVSDDDRGFSVGTEEVNKVRINATNVFYKDDNNDWVTANLNTLKLTFEDTELGVTYDPVTGVLSIDDLDIMVGDVTVPTTLFTQLGVTEEQSEATEIVYNGVSLGTKEDKVLTTDGVIIAVEEDEDRFSFSLPGDDITGDVEVYQ
jgi:outer membrane murein-binding lipoprotein Lpp